jgi:hypothetical protein
MWRKIRHRINDDDNVDNSGEVKLAGFVLDDESKNCCQVLICHSIDDCVDYLKGNVIFLTTMFYIIARFLVNVS